MNTKQDALNKIKEKNQEIDAILKQAQSESKQLLGEAVKQIFEENEDWLESFSWTQYTPYFNDGETCEFSVNIGEWSTKVNEEDIEDLDYLSEYTDWKKNALNPNYDAEKAKTVKDLQELISSLGENNLKSIFGDHVKITVTKDGFEIEDYDHE